MSLTKKILAGLGVVALTAGSIIGTSAPAQAQMAYQSTCRYWEDGAANSVVPCVVQFASDGYVGAIRTQYDTYRRNQNGWALGVRNKECLRSTGGGYQIAICPVTQ
jgi:hypothetical protein